MSTATRVFPPLVDGEKMDQPTFHDRYAAMPEKTRAELVGGVVSMSPLRRKHGLPDSLIAGWLFHYASFTPGLDQLSNTTTKLDAEAEVQPDCQLLIQEAYGGQTRDVDDFVVGAPELVVEVGYASNHFDLGPKKHQYEKSGVLEYLFVGIDPDAVHWFSRRNDRFEQIDPGTDELLYSKVFPGLWLDPRALFAKNRRGLIAALDRGLATPEHAAFVARLEARHEGR